MLVVGREGELATVDRLLDDVAGGFACLTLEGAPGIGKTTIWRQAVDRAREREFIVLSCRPSQSEAKLSFAGLSDLLGTVPDAFLEGLPRPQMQALGACLLYTSPSPRD